MIRLVLIFDIQLNFFHQVFNKLPPDHVGTHLSLVQANPAPLSRLPLNFEWFEMHSGTLDWILDITIVMLGLIIGVVLVFLMTKMFIGGKML